MPGAQEHCAWWEWRIARERGVNGAGKSAGGAEMGSQKLRARETRVERENRQENAREIQSLTGKRNLRGSEIFAVQRLWGVICYKFGIGLDRGALNIQDSGHSEVFEVGDDEYRHPESHSSFATVRREVYASKRKSDGGRRLASGPETNVGIELPDSRRTVVQVWTHRVVRMRRKCRVDKVVTPPRSRNPGPSCCASRLRPQNRRLWQGACAPQSQGRWGTRVAAQLASDVGRVSRRRHGGAAEAAQARRGQRGSRRRLVRLAPDDGVQLLLYVLVVFLGVVLQRGRRRADGELVCLRRGKRGPLRANGDADQREGAEAARRGGGDEAIDEGRTADERRDVGGCGSACVVEQAPTAETATPTPSLPSAMVQLLPDQIIDKPPSRCDKPGYFYDFLIVDDDDEDDDDALIIKYGRSADPVTRRKQWRRQCKGQHQRWQYCWEVPFATKFGFNSGAESLIHEHFKHAGAWLGPSKCNFCMVSHREKYDYRRCGGREGVNEVVVAYLRRLGWPVRVACKGSIRPNRRQKSRLSSRHAGDDQVLGRPPLKRVGLAAQIWRRRAGACRARRDARDYAERCACAARGGAPSAHVCDDDGDSFAVIAGSRTCTHIVPALLGGVEGSLHFFPYSIASQSAQPGADAAREMRTTLLSWRCARERTVFKKVSDALRPCATVPPHMTLVGRFCLAQYPCDYPKQLRLLMADNVTEDTAPSARPYRKTSVLIQALRREGILLEEYRETATCTTWSPWTSSPKFGPCLVAILSKFIPPSVSAPETLYVTLDVHVALWITAKFEQAKERVPTVQDLVNTALDLWSAQVLKHGEEAPWKNAEQLYSTIDSIQHGDAPWKVYKIRYQGQTGVVESFFGGLGTVLSIIKIEFPSFSDEKAMKDSTAEIIQNKSGWPVSCRAGVMRHRAPGASPPAPAPGASPSCPRPAHLGARARPAPGASLTLFTANIGRLYLEGKYHMCFHQK
ncbi:hypothetical protein DFH09DRAFT_1101319 [Mycena vulgaris]|nr:hypothetical protein DFH09DRAFT_1101319 [Mycena vulgaris]